MDQQARNAIHAHQAITSPLQVQGHAKHATRVASHAQGQTALTGAYRAMMDSLQTTWTRALNALLDARNAQLLQHAISAMMDSS